MSSFKIQAIYKDSGEVHDIWCIDNCFGRHQYGYIANVEGWKAMNDKQFVATYIVKEEQ